MRKYPRHKYDNKTTPKAGSEAYRHAASIARSAREKDWLDVMRALRIAF